MLRAGQWSVWFAGLLVVWLVLVDTVKAEELVLGAVACAAGAGAAVWAAGPGGRKGSWRHPMYTARSLTHVPADALLAARALWRRLVRGRSVEGSFSTVELDESQRAATDAAVVWVGSVAPNSYVIAIDRARQRMLVHRLTDPGARSEP